jgi:hypothetical protein
VNVGILISMESPLSRLYGTDFTYSAITLSTLRGLCVIGIAVHIFLLFYELLISLDISIDIRHDMEMYIIT